MLLGGRAGQRLEPVRVVGGALLQRPVAHGGGDGVGEVGRQRPALLERGLQLLEHRLGQAGALDVLGEDVLAERVGAGLAQVALAEYAPVGAPLGGRDVVRAGAGHVVRPPQEQSATA